MTIQFNDVRSAVIGESASIPGPFGARALVYADFVASGRALSFIEDAIRNHVLPFYGNTHTETSFAGRRSTQLREKAREAIRDAVNADPDHAVIFAGSGSTAAVDKLVRAFGLMGLDQRSVVFVGPYEHHSNDLPWRECGAKIVRIPLNDEGQISIQTLEDELVKHKDAPWKIGAFSAASNVTGLRTNIRSIAKLLHEHDGWCIADYAAAGPYIPVRLAESKHGANDRIDACFLSPHKYPGGPGASGLLIADRRFFQSKRPTVSGGGTVSYVTAEDHQYVSDPEHREEGGTPSIVGDIRAGMVLQLKHDLDEVEVERREVVLTERMDKALRSIVGVEILGLEDAERLGIFSFNIRVQERLLHHNYVVALLNDLFGIQARGGCSCAGPYGHELLGINMEKTKLHVTAVDHGHSVFRPGWARLGVNWFFTNEDVDNIAHAISFIAEHGLALLPYYRLDTDTGVWRALRSFNDAPPASFSALWEDAVSSPENRPDEALPSFGQCILLAEDLVRNVSTLEPPELIEFLPDEDVLRWFWLANEAWTHNMAVSQRVSENI